MRHTLTDRTQATRLTSIVNPPCSVTSGRVARRCCRTSGYRSHRAYFVLCTSWPTATSAEARPPHAEQKDKSTPARGRAPTPPTSPMTLRPSSRSFVSGSDSTSRRGCSTNISVDRKQGLLRVRRPVVLNNLECRDILMQNAVYGSTTRAVPFLLRQVSAAPRAYSTLRPRIRLRFCHTCNQLRHGQAPSTY